MKRIILSLVSCVSLAHSVSAQSFVGTWQTDEIVNGDIRGVVSFVFEPQSKVTQVYDVIMDIGQGVKAKVTFKVPGLYLAESAKALTLILDRDNIFISNHDFDYGNFFTANGITGPQIDECKKKVEQLWNSQLNSQLTSQITKVIPFSHIGQLLYCDSERFVIASPQSNLWTDRYEFHRINTDSPIVSHHEEWILENLTHELEDAKQDERPQIQSATRESNDGDKIFDVVEEMPQFPGGPSGLFEYLSTNIQYPKEAEDTGIQGRVIVTFVVEKDGSITNAKINKTIDPSLDKEALRVVMAMPNWIPGKQNGQSVRVKYTVPVTFKL